MLGDSTPTLAGASPILRALRFLPGCVGASPNTGFRITDVVEPTVTVEQLKVYPELDDDLRVPNFIVYVLSKPREG